MTKKTLQCLLCHFHPYILRSNHIVVEMEELSMMNDMENKDKIRKNTNQAVHLMKDNYEKSIEVHNEPRRNFDEQQDYIKHLK